MENFNFIESAVIFSLCDSGNFKSFTHSPKDFAEHGETYKFIQEYIDEYTEFPTAEILLEKFDTLKPDAQSINFNYALDEFINICSKIDFFHYDSDKSFRGRDFVMKKINKHFNPNATLIMDDINDNLFFKNFVEKEKLEFKVLEFQGQYVGLIEKIGLQLKGKI